VEWLKKVIVSLGVQEQQNVSSGFFDALPFSLIYYLVYISPFPRRF